MSMHSRVRRSVARTLAVRAVFLLAVADAPLPAAEQTVLPVASESEVWLRGETNLMEWECRGVELAGALVLATGREELEELLLQLEASVRGDEDGPYPLALPPSAPDLFPAMRLEIPVAALDCGRRAMERDVRDTLRADEFPLITFELDSVRDATLLPGGPGEPVRYRLRLRGELELAGVRRSEELTVTGLRDGPDRFRFYTSLPLAMSDFGLQPPVALFGLLRARDDLTVAVSLVLSAQ